MNTELSEISESDEHIRSIGNSTYLLMPSYIIRAKKIKPGDTVSLRMLSDGSLRVVFTEREESNE